MNSTKTPAIIYWKRVFITTFLLVFCTIPLVILQFATSPMKYIKPQLHKTIMRFTERVFSSLVVITTYLLAPSDLVLTGHHYDLNNESFAPIICNHQLFHDWLFFWLVAWHRNAHGDLKIMAKKELRSLPMFGYLGAQFDFIFLARRWQQDRKTIVGTLLRAKSMKNPMWLLLFPEGTTITSQTLAKSIEYGKQQNWNGNPTRVLYPKSTGLFHSIRALQDRAEYLFDFTMGFEGLDATINDPWDYYSFSKCYFEGKGPKSIHMHCEKIKITDIPGITDGKPYDENEQVPPEFEEWLRNRFMVKDVLMDNFARHCKFPTEGMVDGDGLKQVYRIGPTVVDWVAVLGLVVSSMTSFSWILF